LQLLFIGGASPDDALPNAPPFFYH